MITAENERGARFTQDASKFKKVNIQGKNKKQVRDFDWLDEEKEQSAMTIQVSRNCHKGKQHSYKHKKQHHD